MRQGYDMALKYRCVRIPFRYLCIHSLVRLGRVLPFDINASKGHEGVW